MFTYKYVEKLKLNDSNKSYVIFTVIHHKVEKPNMDKDWKVSLLFCNFWFSIASMFMQNVNLVI
jgi:hypothetical protein